MWPRKLWAHWLLQSVCLTFCLSWFATAAIAQTTQASISTDTVLGWAGVVIAALVGLWSKHQDRMITEAKAKADEALAKAHAVENLLLTQYRPHLDSAATFEAAIKPLREDVHAMRTKFDLLNQTLLESALRGGMTRP